MEFLERHQVERLPGGVSLLLNKRVRHEDFVARLAKPWALWQTPGLALDHEGKNRWGHGRVRVGLAEMDVHLKEFLPKSPLDTALSLGRASRAEKAFLAGLELVRRRLPTPEPLAAITVRRLGWVRRCWILTEMLPPVVSIRDLGDHPERHADVLGVWPWPDILDALGRLLGRINDASVLHRDLSLRNVMVEQPAAGASGPPRLWIIDLNRVVAMDPARWTTAHASQNFERLRLAPDDFEHVLRAHFAGEADSTAQAAAFRAARSRHRLYKRVKKWPRRRA